MGFANATQAPGDEVAEIRRAQIYTVLGVTAFLALAGCDSDSTAAPAAYHDTTPTTEVAPPTPTRTWFEQAAVALESGGSARLGAGTSLEGNGNPYVCAGSHSREELAQAQAILDKIGVKLYEVDSPTACVRVREREFGYFTVNVDTSSGATITLESLEDGTFSVFASAINGQLILEFGGVTEESAQNILGVWKTTDAGARSGNYALGITTNETDTTVRLSVNGPKGCETVQIR